MLVVLEYVHSEMNGGVQHHDYTNAYSLDGVYCNLNDDALDEFLDDVEAVIIAEFDTYGDGSHHYY